MKCELASIETNTFVEDRTIGSPLYTNLCTKETTLCTEDKPLSIEDKPLCTEDTPFNTTVCTEDMPLCTENAHPFTENTSLCIENTHICTENTPFSTENTPISTENTPISTENTPICTENTPFSTEGSIQANMDTAPFAPDTPTSDLSHYVDLSYDSTINSSISSPLHLNNDLVSPIEEVDVLCSSSDTSTTGLVTPIIESNTLIGDFVSTSNVLDISKTETLPSNIETETPIKELDTPIREIENHIIILDMHTSILDTPSAELDTPPTELDTPTAELDTPPTELDTPVKLDTPTAELDTPPLELDTPVKLDTPTADLESPCEEITRSEEHKRGLFSSYSPDNLITTFPEQLATSSNRIHAASNNIVTPPIEAITPSECGSPCSSVTPPGVTFPTLELALAAQNKKFKEKSLYKLIIYCELLTIE